MLAAAAAPPSTAMQEPNQDRERKLLDFTDSLGCFLLLGPKGQLFAIEQVRIADDYSKITPRICSADFHVAASLIKGVKSSNVTLVLQPRDRAHAYFLTHLPAGSGRRPMKVFQQPLEMIEGALDNDMFPIIVLTEVQKAIVTAKQSITSPHLPAPLLPLPVRYLVLRSTLPKEWLEALKNVFLANATDSANKVPGIEDKLATLGTYVKRTMVNEYLAKCLWIDSTAQRVGRVQGSEDGSRFNTFVTGGAEIAQFTRSLARDDEGHIEGVSGVANVIPRLVPNLPWSAPTIHVYDEDFRDLYKLKEHYSLYTGLRALSEIAPPLLVHQGNVLDTSVPIMLVKPANVEDDVTAASLREFPLQHVVWRQSGLTV